MAAVAAHVEDAVRRYFEADDLANAGGLVLDMDSAGRAAGIDAKIETTVQSVTVTSVSENEATSNSKLFRATCRTFDEDRSSVRW